MSTCAVNASEYTHVHSGGISICDINHDGMVTCLAINETRHLPNKLRWAGMPARASNPWLQRRNSSLKSTGSQNADALGFACSRESFGALTALDTNMRSSEESESDDDRVRSETVETVDSGKLESL